MFFIIYKVRQNNNHFQITRHLNLQSYLINRRFTNMQPSSSFYRQPQQTVLVSNNQNPISSDHPMFYVREKNYFLEQLSNKVAVQTKFNQIDLKRNVRVDQLIERHSKINKQIEKEEKKRKMFLNSNQFEPIVGISQQEKRKKRQQKQTQRLRQQLYQNYIEECQIHQAPQKDIYSSRDFQQFKLVKQNEQMKNFTVLSDYRSDPDRRKELYLIDMEIAKLKQQENLEKLVKKKHSQCNNNQFLSKISNSILSSYMVYFDQIFNAMIDDILQEEVIYFNSLEAEYYIDGHRQGIDKKQGQSKDSYKPKNYYKESKQLEADVKALKMMELVRVLDELAYD